MKFAKDGIPTITFLLLAAAAFAFVSAVPAAVTAVLAGLVLWFYRDPDRAVPEGEGLFTSPADGRVVEIAEAEHPFTGPAVKVGIFMNVFSVHVNRAPCMGRVDYLEYVPGRKIAAFAPKASEVNERNLVGLSTPYGPVLMVQIAGLLARRIVYRLRRNNLRSFLFAFKFNFFSFYKLLAADKFGYLIFLIIDKAGVANDANEPDQIG